MSRQEQQTNSLYFYAWYQL